MTVDRKPAAAAMTSPLRLRARFPSRDDARQRRARRLKGASDLAGREFDLEALSRQCKNLSPGFLKRDVCSSTLAHLQGRSFHHTQIEGA